MGLKLQNEFTVAAPLDKTWETLLDIGRVASCMPGAKIESGGDDGIYRGTMKVKLGPMNVAYQGSARLADVDEDAHVSTLDIKAKEQRGQGTASATITNRLTPEGDSTKVIVETDLAITGRQAQFGRGIMEDVAGKMLGDFAKRLEREVLAEPAGEAPAQAAAGDGQAAGAGAPAQPAGGSVVRAQAGPAEAADRGEEVLDLGDVVSGPLRQRVGLAAAGATAVSALLWVITRGRRKGFELKLRYR